MISRASADRHHASDSSGRRDPLEILSIGLFISSSTGRPLADDAERVSETTDRQATPKFSPASTAGRPLIIEPRQILIE